MSDQEKTISGNPRDFGGEPVDGLANVAYRPGDDASHLFVDFTFICNLKLIRNYIISSMTDWSERGGNEEEDLQEEPEEVGASLQG